MVRAKSSPLHRGAWLKWSRWRDFGYGWYLSMAVRAKWTWLVLFIPQMRVYFERLLTRHGLLRFHLNTVP